MLLTTLKNLFSITKFTSNYLFIHSRNLKQLKPKEKKYLHTMKLNDKAMSHVLTKPILKLSDIFTEHGYEIRIAGGAVRDLLMDKVPHDIDFATTATPTEMKEMFNAKSIRLINNKGELHGTITVRLEEYDANFECTTLRIDVVTDGRHAEVKFTTDWILDANRRDLTINSLFLGLDGTVYDYHNGIQHIKERTIQFVGDAECRIIEDYLRILRYFRFYGRVALNADNHDPKILESIKKHVNGLGNISGERIWVELKKIIEGNFADALLILMHKCELSPYIGLPTNFDCENITKTYKQTKEQNLEITDNHMLLIGAGMVDEFSCNHFINRIKCSNKEKKLLLTIVKFREIFYNAESIKIIQDILINFMLIDRLPKQQSMYIIIQLLQYTGRYEYIQQIEDWEIPKFPVTGHILRGIVKRPKFIRNVMIELIELWKKSGYVLTQEELIESLKDHELCRN